MSAASYRWRILAKSSAVQVCGVAGRLTYSTPICLRNSRSSSVGSARNDVAILMPGGFGCTVAEPAPAEDSMAAAPRAILPKSLRSGLELAPLLWLDSETLIGNLLQSVLSYQLLRLRAGACH